MKTLQELKTLEQFETRKKSWKTVQDLKMYACEKGRRRAPPIAQNILDYYLAS